MSAKPARREESVVLDVAYENGREIARERISLGFHVSRTKNPEDGEPIVGALCVSRRACARVVDG